MGWLSDIAGPFVFDPERKPPAINPSEWEMAWNGCDYHRPTRCEFRSWMTVDGTITTTLEMCDPRAIPSADQLAELAHVSVLIGFAMRRERAEFNRCDAENRAERVAPWG